MKRVRAYHRRIYFWLDVLDVSTLYFFRQQLSDFNQPYNVHHKHFALNIKKFKRAFRTVKIVKEIFQKTFFDVDSTVIIV